MAKMKDETRNFMDDIKTLIREEINPALLNLPLPVAPIILGTATKNNLVCPSDCQTWRKRVMTHLTKMIMITKNICLA